jgi:hypothetical protein
MLSVVLASIVVLWKDAKLENMKDVKRGRSLAKRKWIVAREERLINQVLMSSPGQNLWNSCKMKNWNGCFDRNKGKMKKKESARIQRQHGRLTRLDDCVAWNRTCWETNVGEKCRQHGWWYRRETCIDGTTVACSHQFPKCCWWLSFACLLHLLLARQYSTNYILESKYWSDTKLSINGKLKICNALLDMHCVINWTIILLA